MKTATSHVCVYIYVSFSFSSPQLIGVDIHIDINSAGLLARVLKRRSLCRFMCVITLARARGRVIFQIGRAESHTHYTL